jgi:hypothetical protein
MEKSVTVWQKWHAMEVFWEIFQEVDQVQPVVGCDGVYHYTC